MLESEKKDISFNLNIKKLTYFLMACNEKQVKKVLHRCGKNFDNKILIVFLKKLQKNLKFIKKNRMTNSDETVFYWKQFCQSCHHEEVLVVVLKEIMKWSTPLICWTLKIRPEILSYRLNEGLLSLGEIILEKETAHTTEKIQMGKEYCQKLSLKSLPVSIQNFSMMKDNKKWFSWSVTGLMMGLTIILLYTLLFFLLKPHSPVILYQDSF